MTGNGRGGPPHDPWALRSALRADLVAAMKARQPEVVAALRGAIAAIDDAEAVQVPDGSGPVTSAHVAGAAAAVGSTEAVRRDLTAGELLAILREQVAERAAEANLYESLGRADAAERLRKEAAALTTYLEQ